MNRSLLHIHALWLAAAASILVLAACDGDGGVGPDPPETTYTLSVESDEPGSGVAIEVSPADVNDDGDGETSFQRTYVEDSDVTLTAPEEAPNGNLFLRWSIDGADTHDDREITIQMMTNRTVTAVFAATTTLTVASRRPDEGIHVRALRRDLQGKTEGTTPLTLHYPRGRAVGLFPEPTSPEGDYFFAWEYDGSELGSTQEITFFVEEGRTATAHYHPATEVVDTTFDVGGRPSGLPENEMKRTLELDVVTEAAIEAGRIGVFYEGQFDLTALPHTAMLDLNGNGEGDTSTTFSYDVEPGALTIRYVAQTDSYVHPAWLPDRVVVVIYEEDPPLAAANHPIAFN